jgi:AcrR family transcriptional regulator
VPSRSQRREKILEAAGNAFLANGYGDVTMQDVAKEAQISRAALYTYFGSKQEVFNGVIEFFLTVIVQSSIDALERVGEDASIYDKLFAVFDARQRLWLGLDSSQKSTFSFELVKNHHKIIEEKGALPIQRVVKEVITQAYATGELPTFAHTPPQILSPTPYFYPLPRFCSRTPRKKRNRRIWRRCCPCLAAG